jgi:hypothetical protein
MKAMQNADRLMNSAANEMNNSLPIKAMNPHTTKVQQQYHGIM